MTMLRRWLAVSICVLAMAGLTVPVAVAQFEDADLPESMLRPTRNFSGQNIAFCINTASIMADFDRALAAELAGTLLVDHEIVEILADNIPGPPYDFRLPLQESEIYLSLAHRCDALMGFTHLSNYPDWLSGTPPYLTTHTVIGVRERTYSSFSEIGAGQPIGARIMSIADSYLSLHLQTMPEASRWNRVSHLNNVVLIERLLDGSLEAILIWEPAVRRYLADHPEAGEIEIIRDLPFTIAPTEFVVALRRANDFLNLSLTQAIADLEADGTVERLAVEHGLIAPPQ